MFHNARKHLQSQLANRRQFDAAAGLARLQADADRLPAIQRRLANGGHDEQTAHDIGWLIGEVQQLRGENRSLERALGIPDEPEPEVVA